jgi:hypothetical protein
MDRADATVSSNVLWKIKTAKDYGIKAICYEGGLDLGQYDTCLDVKLTVAGDIRVGTSTAGSGCLQSYGGGVIGGTCSSDQNLKTNIVDFSTALDKFMSLRTVTFNWNNIARDLYNNDTSIINTGFIAQNVESLFPELVHTNSEGYKQVDYSSMNIYTAGAVKELAINASLASTTLSNLGVTVANNYADASSSIATLNNLITANQVSASSSIASLSSSLNSNTASLQAQISSITGKLSITNAPNNALTIASNGTVGIGNDGTQLGDEKLRVSGRVRATGFDVDSAADLAENFEAVEAVDIGTIVAFSTTTTTWSAKEGDSYSMSTVRKAHEAHEAVGVVSTNPGIVLDKSTANSVPVAFSGRVPVKVTLENGDIKRGDYLTVSATMPGYAMKLTGEGRAIGRALSDYDGRDKLLMLVENGAQKLDLSGKTATTTGMLTTGNVDLNANGVAIVNIKSLASANGTWYIDENGRVVAKVLCIEDVCIDKNTLTNVLQMSGQHGVVLGTSTQATSTTPTSTSTDQGLSTGTSSGTDLGTATSTTTGDTSATSTPPLVDQATTTELVPPSTPATDPAPPATEVVNPPVDQGMVTTTDPALVTTP